MYELISKKIVVARKKHHCIWCDETIEIGEKYQREISTFYGDFQYHKWHLECDEVAQQYFMFGDSEFEPYSNERPQREPSI